MSSGFDIPWVGGRNTMGREFIISLEGVRYTTDRWSKYHGYRVRYTMCRGFDIPRLGGKHIMGKVFDIPWIGVQNAMGSGFFFRSDYYVSCHLLNRVLYLILIF
jgi:hypothetical protein